MLRPLISIGLFAGLLESALPAAALTVPAAHHNGGKLYTITDYGAPPPSLSNGTSVATAFNNTGQIIGLGGNLSRSTTDCIAYTGSTWVDYTASTVSICQANAVSDLKGGSFSAVGRANSLYAIGDLVGYYATITGSKATMNVYGSVYPSELYAINKTGTAAGDGPWDPLGAPNGQAALMYFSQGKSFTPIDACYSNTPLCPTIITSATPGSGGNHVRAVNAKKTAIGIDGVNGNVMEVTVGKPSSGYDLNVNPSATRCWGVVGVDDGGNFYYTGCPSQSQPNLYTYVYNVKTGKSTALPPISGSSCVVYLPWTVNGNGEIYGSTQNCGSGPSPLWVYSPKTHKTADLSAQLPPGSYNLKDLNDLGQILVDLIVGGGQPDHWAVLNPPK